MSEFAENQRRFLGRWVGVGAGVEQRQGQMSASCSVQPLSLVAKGSLDLLSPLRWRTVGGSGRKRFSFKLFSPD